MPEMLSLPVAVLLLFGVGRISKIAGEPGRNLQTFSDGFSGKIMDASEQPMHELPVTQSILEIALKHAGQANAKRISDLYIVMGELSSIVDDSIQFYWDMIAKDTPAEGASLHFRRVPAEFQCMTCFGKYHPIHGELACPHCGGVGAKIIAGEEFSLEAIDVE